MADELKLSNAIDLTPTSPSWAALFSVMRTLIASAGIIGTAWGLVQTKDWAALYQLFHSSSFATFVAAVAAAVSLAWGYWKKYKGTSDANTLKAAVDPAKPVTAVVPPDSTTATIVARVVPLFLPIAIGFMLLGTLTACASTSVLPPSAQLTAAKGEYSAETTFNLMGQAYELAVPYLSPVQKATAKGWIATAKTALNAARAAQAAGDATGLVNQTNAIIALYGQLKTLAASVGAPTPATGGTNP